MFRLVEKLVIQKKKNITWSIWGMHWGEIFRVSWLDNTVETKEDFFFYITNPLIVIKSVLCCNPAPVRHFVFLSDHKN